MAPLGRTRKLILLAGIAVAVTPMLAAIRPAQGAAPGTILPNLVADPVDGFEIQPFAWEGKTRLLLRFNGYIRNKGPGPVDFRGSRILSSEPMKTRQRLFKTEPNGTNFERLHEDEASTGKLEFSPADGHNHWHLQEIARYSLWNASKTGEVAPAQKVGFCLDDSAGQHVEPGVGPSSPVYSDATGRKFCRQGEPQATELWEGISPGWRDKYASNLALQWVDISNVQPGKYQLREDVNPLRFVQETEPNDPPSFTPVTIPGYVAQPQSVTTPYQTAEPITLQAQEFSPKSGARYEVVSFPSHGQLTGSGNHPTYTPAPGFSGADSFTFRTREESSQFPEDPQRATVSIEVGENPAAPKVQITSAPSSLVAGTSGALTAASKNDAGAIEWSASGGAAVKPEGLRGETATLTAPSQPGTVTVTARLADNKAIAASTDVTVLPAPKQEPSPGIPPASGGVAGQTVKGSLTRPRAMLVGRYLHMSTHVGLAGRVRLSAYWRGRLLGSCSTLTPAGRTYTCRLKLSRSRLHDKLRVVASLRTGGRLLAVTLGPERIPRMVMVKAGNLRVGAHSASYASVFWCSPSAVVATLSGRE